MATALMLGTTEVIADEPGSAYNDLVGTALVLAALALLAYVDVPWVRRGHVRGLWTVALAAGLAVGVKDTFLFPVAALTAGVIALLPKGERTRQGLLWCAVVAVTGGFWYARNLIYAGNPVPNVHFGLGPFRLPSSPSHIGTTISQLTLQRPSMEIVFHSWFVTGARPGMVGAGGHRGCRASRWNRRGVQWTWRTLKESQLGRGRSSTGRAMETRWRAHDRVSVLSGDCHAAWLPCHAAAKLT